MGPTLYMLPLFFFSIIKTSNPLQHLLVQWNDWGWYQRRWSQWGVKGTYPVHYLQLPVIQKKYSAFWQPCLTRKLYFCLTASLDLVNIHKLHFSLSLTVELSSGNHWRHYIKVWNVIGHLFKSLQAIRIFTFLLTDIDLPICTCEF